MAIVQISRITHRKGLFENLPQLAGAELGWCVDSRRLFIGNGTLEDGAPEIGNTEILTRYSDFTDLIDYIYSDEVVGYAAQTGPSESSPTIRPISQKLDDIASVRDFGAVGDGNADDTDAIERALYELYCRATNVQVRRGLFFPAGQYRITRTLKIPTWARLYGEGQNHTIIAMDETATDEYVAMFVDNKNQMGANIGNNGATLPQNIELENLTFQSAALRDIFLIESASNCYFSNVQFKGSLTLGELLSPIFSPAANDFSAIRFSNTESSTCTQIVFNRCKFSNITNVTDPMDTAIGVVVSDSIFDTLHKGIRVGSNSSGYRVVHNFFDNVSDAAITFSSDLNVSSKNIFYNVGNGLGENPLSPIVVFESDNNVSAYDLFSRIDSDAVIVPRVLFSANNTQTGATGILNGRYARTNGRAIPLANNQTTPSILLTVSTIDVLSINVDYLIVRDSSRRTGRLSVVTGNASDLSYSDEFVMNSDDGITLVAVPGNIPNTVDIVYTSTNTGATGSIILSTSYLSPGAAYIPSLPM